MSTLVNHDSESFSRIRHTLLHFVTLFDHFEVSEPLYMTLYARWGDLFHTLLTLINILSHLYQIHSLYIQSIHYIVRCFIGLTTKYYIQPGESHVN